jgi:hypothetical protein
MTNSLDSVAYFFVLELNSAAQFARHILGNVVTPVLEGIECDDAHWVVVLPLDEVPDHRLEAYDLHVGAAPDAHTMPLTVPREAEFRIPRIGDDRGCPSGQTHGCTPTQLMANLSGSELIRSVADAA